MNNNTLKINKINYDGILASLREKRKEDQLRHSEKRVYEFKEVKKSAIISGQQNCVLASLREKMNTV